MIKIVSLILFSFNYRANAYGFKPGEAWVGVHDTAFVMYTEDAGADWIYIDPNTLFGFFDLFFIDSLKGWSGGMAGEIRHTEDGGMTWQRQVIGDTKWISRIQFLDPLHGYASAGDAIVKVTSDGGNTWTRVFTPFTGVDFYGIHFIDTLKGFICSGLPTIMGTPAYLAKSIDGGITWDTLFSAPGYDFFDLWFFDEQNGIVVGGEDDTLTWGPVIFKTTDAGNTWDTITPPGYYLRALHFVSQNTGWACGMFGTIIKTTDGGNTWTLQSTGVSGTLFDIDFMDSLHGIASGQDAILFTDDGGDTWNQVSIEERGNTRTELCTGIPSIISVEGLKKYRGAKLSIYTESGKKVDFNSLKQGIYFINYRKAKTKIIILK